MPDEFPIEEPIIIPKYVIGNLTLSDGQEIVVKDIIEGDTSVDYRRTTGYTGDCMLNLTVSSEANAPSEIIAALEIELVSKTKIDPVSKEAALNQLAISQKAIQDAGMTCSNGIKLQVGESDLIRWTQLMMNVMAFSPATVQIRDYNNVTHTLQTATEVVPMLAEVAAWGQAFLADTWRLKDEITNAN